MSTLSQELVQLILQFLDEEKYKETIHTLEQESRSFFDIEYFEEIVTNGDWDNVEKYLSGFTNIDDNKYSIDIFFKIRKQKYLEALDRKDRSKAVDILMKDLKRFSSIKKQDFNEITQLLTLENIRDDKDLSNYGDTKTARNALLVDLNDLLKANPLISKKLNFPSLEKARLSTLINQSLNWQHLLCEDRKPNPVIKSLYVDHSCGPSLSNSSRAISPTTVSEQGRSPPLTTHDPAFGPPPTSHEGLMACPSQNPHPSAAAAPTCLNPQTNVGGVVLKRPRTSHSSGLITADIEHVIKGTGCSGLHSEVNSVAVNASNGGFTNHEQSSCSPDDFPKAVIMNLYQGSAVKSIDFHPVCQTLVLVGTSLGEMTIWELGSRNRICLESFKVWDLEACSLALQTSLASDYSASINRVVWSPHGFLLGVAFSKHIVHVYIYHGVDIENHLEIEAHLGSVNDIAFSCPNEELYIVTCGDDRLVKVFDAASGAKQYTFEGHESPVYSIITHHKESIQFVLSTDTTGKIKAWLYDKKGSRADYDAPGCSPTNMAYSDDGTRLFFSGAHKEGESYLMEWDESKASAKRTYVGLCKQATSIVQFDTTNNRILAAGDDSMIKFWDIDNVNLMETTDADGGLLLSPCIRFNKNGLFLAVSTNESSIKILANADGVRLIRAIEKLPFDSFSAANMMQMKSISSAAVELRILEQVARERSMDAMTGKDQSLAVAHGPANKSRNWKMIEVNEPSQCHSLRLPQTLTKTKVSGLAYTNSGFSLLVLSANGVHKLWKWPKNDDNPAQKASANTMPELWQPSRGLLMSNDVSGVNLEDAVSCFAFSKNDMYIMSSSGGKISLFSMATFETMMTCMPPPSAVTFLAFHPQQHNTLAIGMDDCSIQIYDIRIDQVEIKLNGHQQRITGLAFSIALNVLVSSGADSQLCVWTCDGTWEKQTSKYLQIPPGRLASPVADTSVQFHKDEARLLAVHETHIAIYEAPKLTCLKQWVPLEANGPITYATYSCDGQSIYVSSKNGSVCVLTASTLQLRCRISLSSYALPNPSSSVYPLVIAAHPTEPNQFALGLSDGGVCVMEPIESQGKWGTLV